MGKTHVACVGLVVMAGSFLLVLTPDEPEVENRPAVIIDAGHGGKDGGAQVRGGIREKDLTLDIALRLERILKTRGYSTVLTRNEDIFVPLPDRALLANRIRGPAVFISIHFNQFRGKNTAGIETYHADHKSPPPGSWTWIGFFPPVDPSVLGEDLAAEVQRALLLQTGARDRGIRAKNLYVTRHTVHPAILVEGGFLSNRAEADLLHDATYAESLATGLADGIAAWCKARK